MGLQRPSRPMKREIEADPNPNPNANPERTPATIPDLVDGRNPAAAAASIDGTEEDEALRGAEFLSRKEVVRRRLRRLNRLSERYKNLYWALAEEVRTKHRDYYWEYGKSPLVEEEDGGGRIEIGGGPLPEATGEGIVENGRGLGIGAEEDGACRSRKRPRCVSSGCKSYSMPLTRYCHAHILLDTKQTLYKGCSFVIKSAQTGPITCGKPVLRATVPILCATHFLKAQKHISQALRKAGLSSSNRPAPKFHVIIAEYVRQIKAKRREASRSKALTIVDDS